MIYPAADNAAKASGLRGITLPVYAMFVLTLIGIADAAYVAHGNYTGWFATLENFSDLDSGLAILSS